MSMASTPETHYARTSEGVHIAYQVSGAGPRDLVLIPGWISHLEWAWEYPPLAKMLERLGTFSRLICFDRRGLGLSDRPDHLPTLEDQVDDVRTVMDAAGSEKAVIFGDLEGTAQGAMFAATHPDRTEAYITYGGRARYLRSPEFPWGIPEELVAVWLNWIEDNWGRDADEHVALVAPSALDDAVFRRWYSQLCRLSVSPAAVVELFRIFVLHDIVGVLPSIHVPTLVLVRSGNERLRGARYFAEQVPDSKFVEVPGRDMLLYVGNVDVVLDEIQEFLTGARDSPSADRVLSTVLITDIVESTRRAASLGDRPWSQLLDTHDRVIERQLERFRGRKVNPTGDGMIATFDGPARGIRCAQAIVDAARAVNLDIRAGLHTCEIELRGEDIAGIGVHTCARVTSLAAPGEVLVSRTVTDLVAGSGIEFVEKGEFSLKGVPGNWSLFSAIS
jgi:class 3 adenylate cyclase